MNFPDAGLLPPDKSYPWRSLPASHPERSHYHECRGYLKELQQSHRFGSKLRDPMPINIRWKGTTILELMQPLKQVLWRPGRQTDKAPLTSQCEAIFEQTPVAIRNLDGL